MLEEKQFKKANRKFQKMKVATKDLKREGNHLSVEMTKQGRTIVYHLDMDDLDKRKEEVTDLWVAEQITKAEQQFN
tara:strand:+ start:171 stop:398 length:228 start_codon:yes stop_codon:yes gene_type:complete